MNDYYRLKERLREEQMMRSAEMQQHMSPPEVQRQIEYMVRSPEMQQMLAGRFSPATSIAPDLSGSAPIAGAMTRLL